VQLPKMKVSKKVLRRRSVKDYHWFLRKAEKPRYCHHGKKWGA